MSEVLYEGWMILAALLPSIGLLYLFFVIVKHLIEGDRRERAAQRELDLRERERASDDATPDTTAP